MRAEGRGQLVVGMILAWAVIYLIHVFAFPVYEGGRGGAGRGETPETLAALEGALCGRPRPPPPRALRRRRAPCPPGAIATVRPAGRTGNLISAYASLWAAARRTGLEPYAPPCLLAPLAELFTNLSIPSLARVRHCRARWSSLARDPREWNYSSQALVLPQYSLYTEEILPRLDALRRELRLSADLRARAQDVLRELAASVGDARPVFVSVHVRRTDYPRYLRRRLRAREAPVSFYLDAMRVFERTYPSALFVVVSDDARWCEERLARGRRRVRVASGSQGGGASLDLALLAACNHSVLDYGTFGLWGALMAGGRALVYDVAGSAAAGVARRLPGWSLAPARGPPTLTPQHVPKLT